MGRTLIFRWSNRPRRFRESLRYEECRTCLPVRAVAKLTRMNTVRLSFLLALATCVVAVTLHAETEPLRNDLGSYTRKVTTKNPKAQSYFNQGLAFIHGFNHASAIRSFQEAANADPDCAMAHWGIALAAGPHINYPLVPPPMAMFNSLRLPTSD